jgi:hypothetical protein
MCETPGVTDEHVPPRSFFPKDKREKLIKVPSCRRHNNDNSVDVEYVRNVIVTDINTNDTARGIFQTLVYPSLLRNRKLFRKTFAQSRPITLKGVETAVVTLNMVKFKKIIKGIANAIYYRDFNKKHPFDWWIYGATLVTEDFGFWGIPDDEHSHMRKMLSLVPVSDRDTNYAEVFKYGFYEGPDGRTFYRLEFYEGMIVYAYASPIIKTFNPKIHIPNRIKG